MVNTIKVEPVDTTDETPSEVSANSRDDDSTRSEIHQSENYDERAQQDADSPSKTKQLYILLGIVIFNAVVSLSLIITLPIVLNDSDDSVEIDDIISTPATTTKLTTPAYQSAVLVLSTYDRSNSPFVVDFDGDVRDIGHRFEYGSDTEVNMGCGASIYDEFWYFGGESSKRRQLSKIVGCKLTRQADMSFDFRAGSCNTFMHPEPKILLCFGDQTEKQCHTFDGRVFHAAGNSSHPHGGTMGMPNYKGNALTVGCHDVDTESKICGTKTELMDMSSLKWSSGPDFNLGHRAPYPNFIFGYSAASTETAAYIIGGMFHVNSRERDQPYDMIARFKDDQWSYYDKLHQGRMGHGSITVGDYTMILGGYSGESKEPPVQTEVWTLKSGGNRFINPALPDHTYHRGMALYAVDIDFCR